LTRVPVKWGVPSEEGTNPASTILLRSHLLPRRSHD
jgi:hypothetical protein